MPSKMATNLVEHSSGMQYYDPRWLDTRTMQLVMEADTVEMVKMIVPDSQLFLGIDGGSFSERATPLEISCT